MRRGLLDVVGLCGLKSLTYLLAVGVAQALDFLDVGSLGEPPRAHVSE